ncbi:MAG TPA: cytochrome c oxidase assembly protein [Acidimicrobiia bacterium]|nr:cytochrome c oxidase assembly protein [Acidimicrobiia bacterium]
MTRGSPPMRVARPRNVALAVGGAALVVALAPPMSSVAADGFSGHMVQHLLLFTAAPLLLVAGDVTGRLRRSVPPRTARRVALGERRLSSRPALLVAAALVVHGGVVGVWHLPTAYDSAVSSDAVHRLEHASMFWAGAWFWWVVFDGARRLPAACVVAVFVAALQMGAVAALLSWAPEAMYDVHASDAGWGPDPLGDQQIGAALMWTVGGAAYVVAGVGLFARWLAAESRRSRFVDPAGWVLRKGAGPVAGRSAP